MGKFSVRLNEKEEEKLQNVMKSVRRNTKNACIVNLIMRYNDDQEELIRLMQELNRKSIEL